MGQVAKLQLPSTAHCENETPGGQTMPACMPADVQGQVVGQGSHGTTFDNEWHEQY
jgi:hypothetical protein